MGVFNRNADGPSPEEREERIGQLRKRRLARLRWLTVRAVLVAGALVLLLAIAGWWLLTTIGGREFLMAQIVARLPAGAELTWSRAEGPASGPLVLHDVHFELPRQRDPECVPTPDDSCAMGTIVFDAQRVMLDPAVGALLGRELRLEALEISDAMLRLPRSDTPFELPRWPEALPEIAPPLELSAADVRIDDFRVLGEADAGGYEQTIAIDRLRGGLRASQGELHIEDLQAVTSRGHFGVDGDYLPGENYRTDLVATAVWPDSGARLGLVARGDLDAMHVGVAGAAPGPLRATLTLRGGERPQWQLQADAEALDPALLTDPETATSGPPLALELQAEGVGGRAQVQGEFSRGGLAATILPSELYLEEQVLQLDPLALRVYDGRVVARGQADFREPGAPEFRFAINARGLEWGGASPAADPAISADADLDLAGTLQAWTAIGEAALTRGDDTAQVEFDAHGNAERLRLEALRARMPEGRLDATGTVAWAPALGWELEAQLAGFDPGYFLAGWDGAVTGELASTGRTRDDGGLEAVVEVADLGGQLRGRTLDGEGRFVMHGAADPNAITRYEGELELSLGNSRIAAEGSVGATLDIGARFEPLQLADLLPDASGTLRGTLALVGARTAPDISADLQGSDLRYGSYAAQSLSVQGQLPWSNGDGALAVRASGLEAGIALDSLAIDARGAVESLQLGAQAEGPLGALALTGDVEHRGNAWQGTLASLQLVPTEGAQWQLQDAAQFSWNFDAGRGTLSQTCLASSLGGSLCASADWPRLGVSVEGQGLPLALVRPYLPEAEEGREWLLRGDIAIDAQLRPLGTGWQGHANVSSASGGLRLSERAQRELIRYQDLQLTSTFRPQGIDAQLSATLNDDGRLQANLVTGWHATAPLNGDIALDIDELTWLELFSPDIVAPSGRITARIALGGTRDEPRIGGGARLTDFSTEIPSLAITLRQGNLRLAAQPDGRAVIRGSVRTAGTGVTPGSDDAGGGVLEIDGSLGWRGQDVPLVLNVEGERVLVSDTRDLHAVVSPDITVRVPAEEPIIVTGTVLVVEANIDLERLDRGVSPSPDVVIVDPIDPEDDGTATALVLDLTLVLGDEVALNGFGLDASLDGRLHVRSEPGREMIATGSLDVDGEYSAYGQELEITRGRLSWSSSPIADPVLDIRAIREIGEVTAGVSISGRATAPQVEVWADPAMSQSQALAYLTLGRPLSNLTGAERNQVSAASAALTAGGSLLAGQIGARLGLDEAGVMQTRTAGSIFGIGKQLSPRLYVGYGVSLLGTGTVLTLKYLLGRGFDIEIESSRIENRASLNWRKEK